jgi:hypothetical protein
MGINVRSDGNIDYASLIVDGEKKYESRKTDSLRPYVGKIVGIVRTGNGPAVAIGQVTIGEPIVVDAEKFNRFRKQHLVPQGSKFDIDSDGTKYLYPMIDPVRWDNEKPIKHRGIVSRKIQEQGVAEDKESDPVTSAVLSFYKPVVNDIHKEKLPDYVDQARQLLQQTNDPKVRSKLIDIFKKGKENPYIQGGIVTTVGALLAGGILTTAQRMGLSPAQTKLALQAILNTVIPTVVSRINGKNWSDTIKYTLASAGIGTGIAGAGLLEDSSLSVEELAQISDKALDDAYHYGRSTPGANFGWMANLQSAKAAKRLIDAGETDIEKISDAIHQGWNVTAAADYKGQLQLDTPTPDEKKLKRAKLAMQSYAQLPEEEKEKDRVVARALLKAITGTE